MRFLMVDKICELKPEISVKGIKNISWDSFFLEETFPGLPVFSPVIISEAAAQLVSWAIIQARDYTVKPVITIVDTYSCTRHIMPGDQVQLEGEIESFSEESALCNGRVLVNGKPAVELQHAVCYLYPLDELDPPERIKTQFKNLYQEGYPLPQVTAKRAPVFREEVAIHKRRPIDRFVESDDPDTLSGIKNITATADYFNDHFSSRPILPGVLTIEALVETAKKLAEMKLVQQGLTTLKPVLKNCSKIKMRRFIEPGDQFITQARLTDFENEKSLFKTQGTVNGKKAATINIELEHLSIDDYKVRFLS